jgi:PASTA domain/FG-GAP repeat
MEAINGREAMRRWFVMASVVACVVAAFLPGSGLGSSTSRTAHAREIPAGLAAALHAKFGPRPLRLADSPTEHPFLGGAVALSADGTTALVSATGAGNLNGAVYVYHVTSPDSWTSSSTPTATLTGGYGPKEPGVLGWSVAISADGTTAFASAPFSPQNATVGAVLVYHVADEASWASTSTPTATLTNADGEAGFLGQGGMAVSDDGSTLVVGDWGINDLAGGAYVYHAPSESAWTSTGTPTATLSRAKDTKYAQAGYGVAISADGTTALVGDDFRSKATGGAYLFHVASEDAWASSSTPTAILSDSTGVVHDLLGLSVALSADGSTALLGAPGVKGTGAVDVFRAADEASWATTSTPTATLTNASGAKNDFFGGAVAISADGTTAFASATGAAKNKGASYVYHVPLEASWASTSSPTATLTNSAAVRGDNQGFALATSGDGATLLVGSPLVNWNTGQADVFRTTDETAWATTSTPAATLTNAALPKPRCIVPGLKGYHVRFARELLAEANCRLGKVKTVHASKKQRKRIVGQSPAHGANLPPGSKVNVQVGK